MSEFTKDLEDYFCKFTFGQFVTLILLELVTLFFVFYLGARYGPDLIGSRSDTARQQSLPPDSPKSVDEIVGKGSVDYTYPEVLTDPSPKTSEGKQAIRIKPSGVTAEEFDRQKKTVLIPREQAAATPPAASPEAKPASPAAAGPLKYAIQIGSYPTPEEANRMIERWRQKGYDPFLSVGEIPDRGTWYRVRLGSFDTREDAADYLDTFKKKENVSALVVQSQS